MKKELAKNLSVLAGATAYAVLFMGGGFGLNALLFSVLVIAALRWTSPRLWTAPYFLLLVFSTLLSAVMVVWHHTGIARVVHVLSFLLLIGYTQQPTLRFVWYGALLAISSLFTAPLSGIRQLERRVGYRWKSLLYWGKLTVIPLAFAALFFGMYYQASMRFAEVFDRLTAFLPRLSLDLSWEGPVRFGLGLLLCGAIFWPAFFRRLIAEREAIWRDDLVRQRRRPLVSFRPLALKREYFVAVLTLGLLNGLLLLTNLLDLRYVWLDFSEKTAAELSQFVHAGTELLILSILMAIGVLVYFFRGNLNFFPDPNRRLFQLASLWLIQNAVLTLSVGFRNFHYLHQYGLTSLRIGVMSFLLLVLCGLYFTYRKIQDQKTIYHLFSQNGWAVLMVLLFASCFNWDGVITRYNLRHEHYDLYYLGYELSDRNLYVLERYKKDLSASLSTEEEQMLEYILDKKKAAIRKRRSEQGWRGWNFADERNISYLP